MRACGSAYRFPGVPAESRNWPALQARPIARVLTSLGIMRITSWIASIAGTEPPGELIHRPMSARGSSAESSSSCCIRRLPLLSSRTSPSTMIRWCMSRWASSSSSRPASAVCVIAPASSLPVRRPRVFCPEQICCQRSARCGIVNRRAYPARPPDQEPRGDRVAHRALPGQAQWCRSRRTLAWGQPRRELSQRCHRGHGRAPDLEPGEAPAVGAAPPSSSHAGLHADVLQHLWRALGGLDAAYARRSDTLRPQCPRHRVRFEWSPGRRSPEYTGDQTAFDVALAFGRTDAEILVGIETKYHEWAEPEDVPHPTERLHRYRDIAETSGIFKADWERRILGKPTQQIWRDHLLLLSLLQHDSGRWVGGHCVLVHPKGNPSFRNAAAEYQKALVRGRNEPTFLVLTVEEVLDGGVVTPETESRFRARYPW